MLNVEHFHSQEIFSILCLVYQKTRIPTVGSPQEILGCRMKMSDAVETPSLRKTDEAVYALSSSIG
jgi:hypothetical protein